jgi:hypothetical protein
MLGRKEEVMSSKEIQEIKVLAEKIAIVLLGEGIEEL